MKCFTKPKNGSEMTGDEHGRDGSGDGTGLSDEDPTPVVIPQRQGLSNLAVALSASAGLMLQLGRDPEVDQHQVYKSLKRLEGIIRETARLFAG